MFIYLALTNMGYQETGFFGKFFKYILLFGVLLYANYWLYQKNQGNEYFMKGMVLGVLTTIAATLTLIVANFIYWFAFQSLPVNDIGVYDDQFGNMLTLQGVLFFEMFVIGQILNFIILQYYKNR